MPNTNKIRNTLNSDRANCTFADIYMTHTQLKIVIDFQSAPDCMS